MGLWKGVMPKVPTAMDRNTHVVALQLYALRCNACVGSQSHKLGLRSLRVRREWFGELQGGCDAQSAANNDQKHILVLIIQRGVLFPLFLRARAIFCVVFGCLASAGNSACEVGEV